MSRLPWLADEHFAFPDINDALREPDGLLAAGGDLSPGRLVEAYQRGIFPWFDDDQPILWWSPDPRCVIDPATFAPSKSLRKTLRKGEFRLSVDTAFYDVITSCRTRGGTQRDGAGTWITGDMLDAYLLLHEKGVAHSIECYAADELVGGLYGIGLGRLFFGESMFHQRTDASKVAFSGLMALMQSEQCPLVDCQVGNDHLYSLGAVDIPRETFQIMLDANVGSPPIDWQKLKGPLSLQEQYLQ